jgi:hypothetical protein
MVVGTLHRAKSLSRAERLENIAVANGLEYRAEAAIGELADPTFTVFEGRTTVENLIRGKVTEVSLAAFDCSMNSGDSTEVMAPGTVVLLPGEGLPAFCLGPRAFGGWLSVLGAGGRLSFDPSAAESVDDAQAVEQFGRLFHLATCTPRAYIEKSAQPAFEVDEYYAEQSLRRLFTPKVLGALVRYPGWAMEARRGQLAIWIGVRRWNDVHPADDWPDLWQSALALRQLILSGASDEPGSTSVLPGDPSQAHSRRFRFASNGGIAGLVVGLFGAIIVYFTLMARRPPLGPAGLYAFPIVVGTFFLGAIVGCSLGAAAERLTRQNKHGRSD